MAKKKKVKESNDLIISDQGNIGGGNIDPTEKLHIVDGTAELKKELVEVQDMLNNRPNQDERSILLAKQTEIQNIIKKIGN
tara:strand:- start:42 stop:284 length:243 start_codon:yes stop_codon:yes gene_type:complete